MIDIFNRFLRVISVINLLIPNGNCQTSPRANYTGLYSKDVDNYEVVVPQRVDDSGRFISNLIPHHYSKRSTSESDVIYYKLPIAGEECIIQLVPNLKMVSPGAVVEVQRRRLERNTTTEKLENMFENLEIKKLQNVDCHYYGFIKGNSSSKVALSTCSGLAGFIQTKNGTYTIEPVAKYNTSSEEAYPHILYKNDGYNWTVCNTYDFNRTVREAKDTEKSPESAAVFSPLYIETLIVIDKNFVKHSADFDSENYILTVFNMAFSLFQDASLGFLIKLSLVRIIRLEVDEAGMNLNSNQDAQKTLKYFQEWQYKMNPGDDSHPNHHDVAILITRLGAEHDGFNNSCDGLDREGFRTVMHPQVLLTTETWSHCTHGYIKTFLDSGYGTCLYDEPSEHHFPIPDILPGTIYNADFQCKQMLSPLARECNEGSTCDSLNCQVPGHLCILMNIPPAAGTRCGENMWCRQNHCLMVGERPDAIDGNWGDWSPWSECSRTCGSGVASSERHCNRPAPSRGGRYCLGKSKRHRICSSKPCDVNKPSFRDMQCGEYDDWIYPEDGLKHTWKEFFFHEENPCVLFCVNENLEVVALKPRVIDGTTCYRGMRDICVDGVCMSIPCDLKLESNAIEDVCGVCHGDGTTCDFSQGQQSMEKFPKAMTKLVTVPVGTRNIKVEEVIPSAARILVRDTETKEFYIRGFKLGMYSVPGSQAWLGMLKSRQEALTIPGPVTRPLTIWIERVENVTVKWSMALPVTQQRKPEFTWDFVRWSPCSAICGRGTQKSEPSCIEQRAGLVESSYCADLEVPPARVRFCEVAKCEARWMVADWKECETVNATKRIKTRMVHCVRAFGEGEGESEIVPDGECPPPKPAEEEPCDPRHKRDSSDQEVAMFSSNRVKFGSHKKYDEYLHLNAIASPDRRSEAIPIHIVNTPHFRHYYRVLQATDKEDKEKYDPCQKRRENVPRSHFYKSTYSGNQQMRKRHSQCRKRHTFFFPVRYNGERNRKKFRKTGKSGMTVVKAKPSVRNRFRRRRRRRRKALQRKFKDAKLLWPNTELLSQEGPSGEISETPAHNYTIRFGHVMVDKDEDMNLEIILEEGDNDNLLGVESERDKMWNLKDEEAIQFLGNITATDWNNTLNGD
ncbi:UNVERIFIED_CONTAM: hypothetical protein PYX00_008067 [Menopon gallinae]|uniref:Peptidase M12B domain-containing protein n=1 Tax=Menopon gallinae TaxID=328185 RepID=A0AAW2HM89_9NEOP